MSLVDPATLAIELGMSRDFVYEHADELGVLRLGNGPKARLRFDLDAALACYRSKRSQPDTASADGDVSAVPTPHRRRLPVGSPQPGSILPIRPRRKATHAAE